MIVRLDEEQQKTVRRQLLSDTVYIISHDALRQLRRDGQTELSSAEVFLSAQRFCESVLSLPDAAEGVDEEIDDLEEEAVSESDAVLILTVAAAQMQAMSKRRVGVDFKTIIFHIFKRVDGHELLLPLIEQMTDKEDKRWIEGKKADLLSYELREIRLDGGSSKDISDFMEKYVKATLSLTESEIKSTLIVLSSLNLEYNHAFDKHIASLCDKLGIKPTDIHNHFGANSGCQVFNAPVTGQFDKR